MKTEPNLKALVDALKYSNSYSRLPILLENCPADSTWRVRGSEWFKHLGREWSCCDNIGEYRRIVRLILRKASRAQLDAMMDEAELKAWQKLPEKIEAYRGCDIEDTTGVSFSLSRQTAEEFVGYWRYQTKNPALLIALINKDRAILKLDRGEDEIISPFATITGMGVWVK